MHTSRRMSPPRPLPPPSPPPGPPFPFQALLQLETLIKSPAPPAWWMPFLALWCQKLQLPWKPPLQLETSLGQAAKKGTLHAEGANIARWIIAL